MDDPRDFWNARYAEGGYAYGDTPNDFLREVASEIPAAGPVLCLAEGEGRNAVLLATLGHPVTAVDLSDVGLRKAQALAHRAGVQIAVQVADLADYPIETGRWAAIVCIWMHLPQPLRAAVLARAVEGLAPGGVLVFEAYTPRQLDFGTGGPRDAAMLVDPETLRNELGGLSLERFDERERMVHEGRFHNGNSAVIQVLGRKR